MRANLSLKKRFFRLHDRHFRTTVCLNEKNGCLSFSSDFFHAIFYFEGGIMRKWCFVVSQLVLLFIIISVNAEEVNTNMELNGNTIPWSGDESCYNNLNHNIKEAI